VNKVWTEAPKHDQYSHLCDALRTLAMGIRHVEGMSGEGSHRVREPSRLAFDPFDYPDYGRRREYPPVGRDYRPAILE
jgi:hypothetical protein